MTQQPIQSQEKAEQSESEQQQNSQVANKEQSNVPAGDAMFGEYKEDGTYCTVGGCLTPEQQKTKKKQIMKRWKIKDILVKSTMKFRIKLQNYNNKETMEKFHQKNLRIVILNYMIDNPI